MNMVDGVLDSFVWINTRINGGNLTSSATISFSRKALFHEVKDSRVSQHV